MENSRTSVCGLGVAIIKKVKRKLFLPHLDLRNGCNVQGCVAPTPNGMVVYNIDAAQITTREFEVPTACNAGFSAAYQNLKGTHCFCISSGGVATACFLLGEIHQQWCGLVSIAINSD